jgi:DNA-binding transcriptional MerR regulator
VTDRPALPLKLYYRIGEVATVVGVETHVLRYWESEFPTIRPQKSSKGHRVYSRKDVEKLIRVKQLLYSEGYTVQGAKRKLQELIRTEPGTLSRATRSDRTAAVPTETTPEPPRSESSAQELVSRGAVQHDAIRPQAEARHHEPRTLVEAKPEPPMRPQVNESHLEQALLLLRSNILDELSALRS